MKLSDIIALAKAGYSVADVKELIALQSSEADTPVPEDNKVTESTQEQQEDIAQPSKAVEKVTPESEDSKAIEEYKAKIQELEEKVNTLQSENIHKDVSDVVDTSDEDIVNDLVRTFM